MAKITTWKENKEYWDKKRKEGAKNYQEKRKKNILVAPRKKESPVLKSSPKKRCKIKKVSVKQGARLRKYLRIRSKWVTQPENVYCKLHFPNGPQCTEEEPLLSSDVHHTRGTVGQLLFDTKTWLPAARVCHEYAHANHKEAEELGYIKSRHAKIF